MKITDFLNRITVGRALLIGTIIAVFYYVLMFDSGTTQKATIARITSRVTELNQQITDAQAKLDRAAVHKKTAAEVGSTITRLLILIPERFGMSDLMRIVSNEAKVAGSSLRNIDPNTVQVSKVAPQFEELTVKVDMSGSFLQHMVFLSNLTKVHQILIIRKFDLNQEKEGRGDEPPTVSMSAEIVAYRYRADIDANKTGQPGQPGQPQRQTK